MDKELGSIHPYADGRRDFLNAVLAGAVAALGLLVLYPVWKYLIPPSRRQAIPTSVLAAKASELAPNSGKIFRFGSKPGIVIRTPGGDIKAFTAICTHLDCTVQYRPDFQHIWCACHNGHYSLEGINIAGPPPRPLTPFKVNIKSDEIFASKES